jgi:hypothetical protein
MDETILNYREENRLEGRMSEQLLALLSLVGQNPGWLGAGTFSWQ